MVDSVLQLEGVEGAGRGGKKKKTNGEELSRLEETEET